MRPVRLFVDEIFCTHCLICISCLLDIVGARFHCAICDSVDICSHCESAGLPGNLDSSDGGHNSSHILIKVNTNDFVLYCPFYVLYRFRIPWKQLRLVGLKLRYLTFLMGHLNSFKTLVDAHCIFGAEMQLVLDLQLRDPKRNPKFLMHKL